MKSQTLNRSSSSPARLGAFHQQRAHEAAVWFEAQRSRSTLHTDDLSRLAPALRVSPEQVLSLHGQFPGEVHGWSKPLTAEGEHQPLSDADLAQRFMALSIEACPSHDRWEYLQTWLRHAPKQPQHGSVAPDKLAVQVLTLAANDHTDFQELIYRGVMPHLETFSEAVQIRLLLCVAHAAPDFRQQALNGLRARGQLELAEQVEVQLNTAPAQWSEQEVEIVLAQLEQSSELGDLAHRSQLLLLCAAPVSRQQRDRLLNCIEAAFVQNLSATAPGLEAHAGRWAWMEQLPPQLALDAFKRLSVSQQQRLLLKAPDNAVSAVCAKHMDKPLAVDIAHMPTQPTQGDE